MSRIFKINNEAEIVCESEGTRYGFRHLATLYINGLDCLTDKCCYYNRTWEAFPFQTVVLRLLEKAVKDTILTQTQVDEFKNSPRFQYR